MIDSYTVHPSAPNHSVDHDIDPITAIRWSSRLYVGAWIAGLALQPAGVTGADTGSVIARHYADHRAASLTQEILVHAVAGVALLVFAIGLARRIERSQHTAPARWLRITGIVAAALSLVQALIGTAMIATAGSAATSTTRHLLLTIERLDAAKLIALAGVCATGIVLARAGMLARWSGRVAAAATACLVPAAIALSGAAPALTAAAVPALVLLLVWVGGMPSALRRAEG